MRIAHLADMHLGFRQFQRLDASGVNQREADVAAAFRRAVDTVIDQRPDAVVLAGDLFHSVRPTNRAIIEAFTGLRRLREALPAAPVVLIAGNHDTPRSVEAGSILKLMGTLGVDVVDDAPRRLDYPDLGLSVLALPHASLLGARATDAWRRDDRFRHNVLVLHPEVPGLFPEGVTDYGGARVELAELTAGGFDYVALGHYHIVSEVAPHVWYSGSLEYTSHNIWGEWREERRRGLTKGFLVADLGTQSVERVSLPPARRIADLEWLDAAGMTAAELDAAIHGRLVEVPSGVDAAVVRLVVQNVPSALAHALNHEALRPWRAAALHLHLDLRRPEPPERLVGVGGPTSAHPLADVVADYLGRRPLDADLDRSRLVALGREYLDEVERALLEGEGKG
ncbi:MAG TPA: exonuclease SbcCD subunit D [Gemmatimonadales bacterium]|nr:exonuclease SbcCD subunit D [Gemmatimonadales bacterium]